MRRTLVLLVGIHSAAAHADSHDSPDDPRRTVIPTFELTGKTSGEGTVRIGLDLLVPFANHINEAHFKLAFEAASHDGLSTILSSTADGFETESSVAGRLDLTYTTLQRAPGLAADKLDVLSISERRAALRDCAKWPGFAAGMPPSQRQRTAFALDANNQPLPNVTVRQGAVLSKTDANGKFQLRGGGGDRALQSADGNGIANASIAVNDTTLTTDTEGKFAFAEPFDIDYDPDVDELSAEKYCADARSTMRKALNAKTLPLPRRQLAASFSAGRSEFKQLSPTGAPMSFKTTTTRKPRFAAALGYAAYAPAERLSAELAASLESSYSAPSTKARWCVPAGNVVRPDGSASDPAETCREQPLGDPVRSTTLAAAGYIGFVGDDYSWRVAMGPTTKFSFGGEHVAYDLGFEIPFYLVRASAEFSGVVRVAPAALLTRDADGVEDSKVLLTLTLLGNRTLFDTAFR